MNEILEEHVKSNCPYCNHQNTSFISILQNHTTKEVITCDCDEGGYDKDYVLTANCIIKISVFSLVDES